ncbi:MAG: glycoside hydrolase family 20 zincin-like fold domain-containing protein [Acidobacteriaceae bacterium]
MSSPQQSANSLSMLLAVFVLLLLSLPAGAQAVIAPALIPMPREIHATGSASLMNGLRVSVPGNDAADLFAANDLTSTLASRGIPAATASAFTVELLRLNTPTAQRKLKSAHVHFDAAMQQEGYVLLPGHSSLSVIAATPEGIFYGVQTIKQLVQGSGHTATIDEATIRDWPAMRYRGLDDDLSRGPVPTLEYQKKQIRTLAAYKINIYSPYFENTFKYKSNPLPAPPDGAMTEADARALIAYAKPYHITIIPEQEAFGHLHHVLTWEQYAPLAETPHGSVLAPGQAGSLPLIKQWFDELATIFPSPFLHIGADETFELGQGQTQADVQARGLGAVYIDFLKRIYTALQPLHRRLLFWGDIAMSEPELVKQLPSDMKRNMIAVAWEYNPHPEGYSRWLKPYTDAGMETWVAPGVNNWSRVYPNNTMALDNIEGFVREGQRVGSTGMLNTVWNDDGEGLFDMDWYGVLFGAAAAWQPTGTTPTDKTINQFEQSYGQVFHGDTTGKIDQAQLEMMQAHNLLKLTAKVGDGSDGLFWIDPWSKDGQVIANKVRPVLSEVRLHAERALVLLDQARESQNLRETPALDALELGARRMDFIGLKFQLADQIAAGYARAYAMQNMPDKHRDVTLQLSSLNWVNGYCEDIRDGYSLTRDLYQQAWLRENRPYWLRNVLAQYDHSTQLWLTRIDTIRTAQRQWAQTHTLPPASELGIPPAPAAATPTPVN